MTSLRHSTQYDVCYDRESLKYQRGIQKKNSEQEEFHRKEWYLKN